MNNPKMTTKQLKKAWRKYLLDELLPYVNEVVEYVNGEEDEEPNNQDDDGTGSNPPGNPPPPPTGNK